MRDFWNRRAEEDPFYFVDNRLANGGGDLEVFWRGGEDVVATFLSQLGVSIPSGATVLDIGCGVGRTTRALARRGERVIGLDVSERMLELAEEHNRELANIDWLLGDGRRFAGVGSATVDVCFSHVVFQHIPDPALTLGYVSEIGRVLRPGGWAALQVSDDPQIHRSDRLRRVCGRLLSLESRTGRPKSSGLARLGGRPRANAECRRSRWRAS